MLVRAQRLPGGVADADDAAPLIVGFDGSTSATAALRWAAGAGRPLVMVRVLSPRPPGAQRRSFERNDPARVFGGHADAACRTLEDCAWRAELVEASSPAAGLAASARRHAAGAIVVGSSPSYRHGCGVLGSEPYQLFAEADVPVVVIPPQAGARLLRTEATRPAGHRPAHRLDSRAPTSDVRPRRDATPRAV